MRKKCPICGKHMHIDTQVKGWICPKTKINQERKVGCGYSWSLERPAEFVLFTQTKEKAIKADRLLGGKE